MQVVENFKIKEKVYTEKLENGLTIMIIPKKDVRKKYVIWGTNYGSNDYKFIVPGEELTNKNVSVDEYIEKIEKVSREGIMNIADNVYINTIYFLKD